MKGSASGLLQPKIYEEDMKVLCASTSQPKQPQNANYRLTETQTQQDIVQK